MAFARVARELERTGYELPGDAWLRGYVSFLDSQKRDLIIRGGRGAWKSTTFCEWAWSHVLHAPWVRRPGTLTRGVIMTNTLQNGRDIIGKLKDMGERLRIPHEAASDYVRLIDRPWEFRLYANNPSSFLGIEPGLVIIDEADDETETGTNSLRLVVERLTPRLRDPVARMILASAPYDYAGYFAERFEQGDTDQQATLHVPTWEGNRHETKESCRAAATDEKHFLQAFAGIPQRRADDRRPFEAFHIDRALADSFDRGTPVGEPLLACDPSGGKHDSFVWVIARVAERADGTHLIEVIWASGEFGAWAKRKQLGQVIDRMAEDAKRFGIRRVHTDSYEALAMRDHCERHGLKVTIHKHTTESKGAAIERLQSWFEFDQIALPSRNGNRIRKALLDYREKVTRTGLRKFDGIGKRSDDFVAALLTLVMAEQAGALDGSLNARPPRNDPPPVSGAPLESWRQVHGTQHPIERIELDTFGRAHVRRNRSPLDGGGF